MKTNKYKRIIAVEIGNKTGFINTSGKIIIKPKYDSGLSFEEGLAPVKINDKWGFINERDELLIRPVFEKAEWFSEGLAPVMINDKWGYINDKSEFIIEPKFDEAWEFRDGIGCVCIEGKWALVSLDGNLKTEFKYDALLLPSEKYVGFQIGNVCGFLNQFGNEVLITESTIPSEFCNGLAAISRIEKKWLIKKEVTGFINKNGQYVIIPKYEDAHSFAGELCGVKMKGKWGMIDIYDNILIPFLFEDVGPFSEGLIPVKLNGKWGYINIGGKIIIKPNYDFAMEFEDGVAEVDYGNSTIYIDNYGNQIWSQQKQTVEKRD